MGRTVASTPTFFQSVKVRCLKNHLILNRYPSVYWNRWVTELGVWALGWWDQILQSPLSQASRLAYQWVKKEETTPQNRPAVGATPSRGCAGWLVCLCPPWGTVHPIRNMIHYLFPVLMCVGTPSWHMHSCHLYKGCKRKDLRISFKINKGHYATENENSLDQW